MKRTLTLVLALCAAPCLAQQHFLTLPYGSGEVVLTSGWFYDDGTLHRGIDYAFPPAEPFEVRATAEGYVVAVYDELSDFGEFVVQVHNEVGPLCGRRISLYAHLERGTTTVPFKNLSEVRNDITSEDFADWQTVSQGDLIGVAGRTGLAREGRIHLHYEVNCGGYAENKSDPYDIYDTSVHYPEPCGSEHLWTECPPVQPPNTSFPTGCGASPGGIITCILVENEPGEVGKDIWVTSTYAYDGVDFTPGGGLNDHELRTGGFSDWYYALLQFNTEGLPRAKQAWVAVFFVRSPGSFNQLLYLDRPLEDWDWRVSGTGRDRERLWWVDRPDVQVGSRLPDRPLLNEWFLVDITALYNDWVGGAYPNYGIQLRPHGNGNQWAIFASSNNADESLRPRLIVVPE
ncbi:DNRLRE domain-containing protein [Candidatus Wolfebacteria bacterium]|nr:DNRLRE domain-containing protein [Candidatus Wolfebacteria bacterium]